MKFVTAHHGTLQTLDTQSPAFSNSRKAFALGEAAIDRLLPGQALPLGAVHEVLYRNYPTLPLFFPAFLAHRAAAAKAASSPGQSPLIVWADPTHTFYPPAAQQLGIDLQHLYILRPRSEKDEIAMVGECMVCQAVAAVVAPCTTLTQLDARRLQLAAERGGGIGILLRPAGKASATYAAATRWLISPAPGERTLQRWKLQLLHGHAPGPDTTVYLEYCRETHTVHSSSKLAHRAPAPQKAIA